MKTWDQFWPFVLPEVIGCPNPTVNFALAQAAREFCQRTSAWREWSDTFTATGLVQRFDFDLPSQTELVAAKRCSVNGEDVQVLGSLNLPPDWSQTGTTFCGEALIHISMAEYMLYPLPTAGDVVAIEVAVKPTLAATGVGDDVYTKYAETVAKGALYRLLSSTRKPWTDLASAVIARTAFEAGVHQAANEGFRQIAFKDRKVKAAPL